MLDIHTDRLRLRLLRLDHVANFTAYRNDPRLAEYQAWELPFTSDQGHAIAAEQANRDDVADGEWTTIAIELDRAHIGDVVANVHSGGGVAEIGYSLMAEHQGLGYASEAAGALVDHLIAGGAQRIEAGLDTRNVPSMRVLEAIGLQFECIAKQGFRWRGSWVDDVRYAMTADERRAWVSRDLSDPQMVQLVPITPMDSRRWAQVRTHYSQRRLVSPVDISFADALFPEEVDGVPVTPWLRGILADGERAGFMMLAAVTPAHPEPYLWRLLIDRQHQRRSIGGRAIAELSELLRAQGCATLLTSYIAGVPGSPEPFYRRLGFVPTGEMDGDETIARLSL